MAEVDNAELTIEILAPQATNEQLDRMARQLLIELRDLHVGTINLAAGPQAPDGAKSIDTITLGAIAIAVLPSFLPKIVEAAEAWVLRGNNRTIKFKGKISGQAIEFEGTLAEFQEVLSKISKDKKK